MTNEIFKLRSRTVLAILMLAFLQFPGCTTLTKNQTPELASGSANAESTSGSITETAQTNIEENYGIGILSTRTSAAGQTLDFHFQVLESEKASLFLKCQVEPYLID